MQKESSTFDYILSYWKTLHWRLRLSIRRIAAEGHETVNAKTFATSF